MQLFRPEAQAGTPGAAAIAALRLAGTGSAAWGSRQAIPETRNLAL
jgi:hypothetical protein